MYSPTVNNGYRCAQPVLASARLGITMRARRFDLPSSPTATKTCAVLRQATDPHTSYALSVGKIRLSGCNEWGNTTR